MTNSSLFFFVMVPYFPPTSVTVIMISNELLNYIIAFCLDELHSVTFILQDMKHCLQDAE